MHLNNVDLIIKNLKLSFCFFSFKMESLTKEQHSVFNALLSGHNIALLGAAGCGKSYLLSVIYTEFPGLKKGLPRIQMCALTGCAALLLGHKAKTLHSWAGIGLGKGTVSELYMKIRKNKKSFKNWISTDLLIIDEISMMTAELLDKLNELGKKIRSNHKLFGGIQLLLVGDFFQLPPINKNEFAFESNLWKELITLELTHIFRQKEEKFQQILKEARMGDLTKESCDILSKRQGLHWQDNKIRPTLLFPKRAEVDMINETNLRALTGQRHHYKVGLLYEAKIPDDFIEDENFQKALQLFDSNASYSTELELAVEAQVMLIANVYPEEGLVNGSRGIITGFSLDLPVVEFMNGVKKTIGTHAWSIEDYEFVSRTQVPLRLAYASTIHKLQGSTLDSALIDIGSGIFEYGQAYVALSRVRSLDALYVYDFNPVAFKIHPKVKEFYKNLKNADIPNIEPIVGLVGPDIKQIISMPSIPIQGIHVIKEEQVGPDANANANAKENNWLYDSIPDHWKEYLLPCKEKLLELSNSLSTKNILPSRENIWNALIPIESIKVVILGQDPYPNGNAHGLAFSVLPDVPIPMSLKNIYKELVSDGFVAPVNGCLDGWSKQGVMLLNTILTIEESNSHFKMGWEEVTNQIIRSIAKSENVIFVLWGKTAQTKKKLGLHHVIESTHPSPLSAYRGFFGSKPFSTINQLLTEMGKEIIDWSI